jgi:hypothetical protein
MVSGLRNSGDRHVIYFLKVEGAHWVLKREEGHGMKSTAGQLVEHLVNRGMPLSQIAAYVAELGSMIAGEPSLSIYEIERAMRGQGWGGFALDERTYLLTLLAVVETLTETGPEKRLWPGNHATIGMQLN